MLSKYDSSDKLDTIATVQLDDDRTLQTGVMYRAVAPASDGVLVAGDQFSLSYDMHQSYFDPKPWPLLTFLIFRRDGDNIRNKVRYYTLGEYKLVEASPLESLSHPGSYKDLRAAFAGAAVVPDISWARERLGEHRVAIRSLQELYPGCDT